MDFLIDLASPGSVRSVLAEPWGLQEAAGKNSASRRRRRAKVKPD